MNKTQLAKLLIKHPEIKALYESQAFDTSTINKVIAEEIVREQEDGGNTPEAYAEETEILKQEYDRLIDSLKAEEDDEKKKEALDDLKTSRGLLRDAMRKLQNAIKQELEDYGEDAETDEMRRFAQEYRKRSQMLNAAINKLSEKVDKKSAEVAKSPSVKDDAQLTGKLRTATTAIQAVADDPPGSEEEQLQKVDTAANALSQIDTALDGIEVEDSDAANASNDGEENAEETAQESTHLNIMKTIFGDGFEAEYPILSQDQKFLELLAKAIAEKRNVPAQAEKEAKPVNENQDANRAAEIEKLQTALNEYENGSLAGIDVEEIAKTAQSLKNTSSGVVDLVLELLADSVAEKATETLVTPILDKINTIGDGAAAAQAAASVGTGGTTLLSAGATLLLKKVVSALAQEGLELAISKGIKALLKKGFEMIPKADVVSQGDQILIKVLGQNVWKKIDELVKQGDANREQIQTILEDNWQQILSNFIVVSASGDLGESLREWSVEAVTFEVAGVPVGPFLAKQLGLSDQQIQQVNQEAAEMAAAAEEVEAQAADEETGSETTADTEDQPATLAAKGWSNAKAAANAIVKKEGMDIDQIRNGLRDIASFKELFNVRSNEEAKFAQAQQLFEDGYFAKRLEELSQQAKSAETKEALPTQDIENLAATYMSYIDYLNALPQEPQFKEDFQMPAVIPTSEEEFEKQFIEPIAPEGATVGTSTEDYIALGKQVIQQAGDLLTEFTDNEVVQRFLGWYVGGLSNGTLKESVADIGVNLPYAQRISQYDKSGEITKVVKTDVPKWNNIFEKLDELIKNGDISIEAPSPTEEPVKEPAQIPTVEEAEVQGEQDAEQDAQLPPLGFEEAYKDYKEILDGFFSIGSNDGFMDQFLLKYQSKKLWELIGTLTRIEAGVEGEKSDQSDGEMQAFTTAKDDVKAGVRNEGIGDFFKRDKKPEISKEARTELRTSLSGMLQAIKSLKAMMDSYRDNMTRSSANPKLDGSALKKSLMVYMENLQDNIASIIERCYIEQQRLTQLQTADIDNSDESKPEVQDPAPQNQPFKSQKGNSQLKDLPKDEAGDLELWEAIAPALDGVYLMEDAERDGKIEIVQGQYDLMREEYQSNLSAALETTDRRAAMTAASTMLGHAKKEEFLSLFPSYLGTYKGKPVSIDDAIEAIQEIVKEFVETMKNVITLAKGQLLEENSLTKVIDDLGMLSQTIENYFGIKSKIPDDLKSKVEKLLAQRKENESLSDDAKPTGERSGELMDKVKDLARRGLEKLKQLWQKLMQWLRGKDWNKLLAWFKQNKPEDLMPVMVEVDEDIFAKKIQEAESEEAALKIAEEIKELGDWLSGLQETQRDALNKLVEIIKKKQPLNESQENDYLALAGAFEKLDLPIKAEVVKESFSEFRDTHGPELHGALMDTTNENPEKCALFIAENISGLLKPSKETASDLSEPSADEPPAPADAELDDEQQKSLDWYNSLGSRDKTRAQAFASKFLEVLREEGKVQGLVSEENKEFHDNLTSKYGVESLTSQITKALNKFTKMQGGEETRDGIIELMNTQPLEFSQFVYNLTTSDSFGDAIFGPAPTRTDSAETESGDSNGSDESDSENYQNQPVEPIATDSSLGDEGVDSEIKRIRKIIQKHERSLGIPGEATKVMKDFLAGKDASELGKDSVEALASIIEIAKIILNDLEEFSPSMDESISKILNKIKKSAKTFMQNRKVKSEFSAFKGGFYRHLGTDRLEKAKPYLMFLLKFMSGSRLLAIVNELEMNNGDIDSAKREIKDLYVPDSSSTNTESLERSLKPIIEKMLKEHYNH